MATKFPKELFVKMEDEPNSDDGPYPVPFERIEDAADPPGETREIGVYVLDHVEIVRAVVTRQLRRKVKK